MADNEPINLTALTVDLLSAYFANNSVDSGQLSGLIQSTHAALKGIDAPEPEAPAMPEFTPAVGIRKSLSSSEHIVSLIDGKPYKTLKRHLSGHGLTPAEYRDRYKLPHDYPMVAPAYSQARRDVAARLGLGRKPRGEALAPLAPEPMVEAPPLSQPASAPIKTKAKSALEAAGGTKAPAKVAAASKPAGVKKGKPKAKPAPAASDIPAALTNPVEESAPAKPRKKLSMRLGKDITTQAAPRDAPKAPTKRGSPKAKPAIETPPEPGAG